MRISEKPLKNRFYRCKIDFRFLPEIGTAVNRRFVKKKLFIRKVFLESSKFFNGICFPPVQKIKKRGRRYILGIQLSQKYIYDLFAVVYYNNTFNSLMQVDSTI